MKTIKSRIKKTIQCKVIATNQEVKIKFPKQLVQSLAIVVTRSDGTEAIVKQAEIYINGDKFEVQTIK